MDTKFNLVNDRKKQAVKKSVISDILSKADAIKKEHANIKSSIPGIRAIMQFFPDSFDKMLEYYKKNSTDKNLVKILVSDVFYSEIGDVLYDDAVSLDDIVEFQTFSKQTYTIPKNDSTVDDFVAVSKLCLLLGQPDIKDKKISCIKSLLIEKTKRDLKIFNPDLIKDYSEYTLEKIEDFLAYITAKKMFKGEFKDALSLIEKFADPSKPGIKYQTALLNLSLGRYKENAQVLESLASEYPDKIYLPLARSYLLGGENEKFNLAVTHLGSENYIKVIGGAPIEKISKDILSVYYMLLSELKDPTEELLVKKIKAGIILKRIDLNDLEIVKKKFPAQIPILMPNLPNQYRIQVLKDHEQIQIGDEILETMLNDCSNALEHENVLEIAKRLKKPTTREKILIATSMMHINASIDALIGIADGIESELPQNIKLHLAKSYYQKEAYEKTISIFENLPAEKKIQNRNLLALCFYYTADFTSAYELFKSMNLSRESDFILRFAYIVSSYGLGLDKKVEMREMIDKTEVLFSPKEITPELSHIIAKAYEAIGDNENSLKYYLKCLEFKIENPALRQAVKKDCVDILIRIGNKKAIKISINLFFNENDALTLLARSRLEMYIDVFTIEELEERYEKIKTSEDIAQQSEFQVLLAEAYAKKKEYSKAKEHIFEILLKNDVDEELYKKTLKLACNIDLEKKEKEKLIEFSLSRPFDQKILESLLQIADSIPLDSSGFRLKQSLYRILFEKAPDVYRNNYAMTCHLLGEHDKVVSLY